MAKHEHLSDEQLEELRKALISLQKTLEDDLKNASSGSKPVSLDDPIGRVSRIDAIQMQQLAKNQRARIEVRIQQVTSALNRLKTPEFGICIECEEPITFDRLKVRPEGTLCLACQKRGEAT